MISFQDRAGGETAFGVKIQQQNPTSFRVVKEVPETLASSNCANTKEPSLTSLALKKISLSSP